MTLDMLDQIYSQENDDFTLPDVTRKGFRKRTQKSGKVFYYIDTGGKPRKEIPLGPDLEAALEKYDWMARDASTYRQQDKAYYLYRHFDKGGILLYVGIALNPVYRLAQHKKDATWFWSIARIEIARFETRELSEAAERAAIKFEKPLFNLRHAHKSAKPVAKKLRTPTVCEADATNGLKVPRRTSCGGAA